MKQKLLLFILPVLFFTVTLQAQNPRTWDFGNDRTNWPIMAASNTDRVVDGLSIVAGGSNFSQIEANVTVFPDTYEAEARFKSGGASTYANNLPTKRYLSFPVTGNSTIKVWFRTGSTETSTPRTVIVSDGTNILAELGALSAVDPLILSVNYIGNGGTIYIYNTLNGVNYNKIEVTDYVLGVDAKSSPVSTNVQAIGNRVFVSNVKSSTDVNIYSITGALVKSFKTNTDMDFTFKSGLYIATVKTAEGQKSVKLLMK